MWIVDSEDCGARLRQVGSEIIPADGDMIGAAGKRTWTFETPSANENYIRGLPCDMKFTLKRPWENDASQEKTVRIVVN